MIGDLICVCLRVKRGLLHLRCHSCHFVICLLIVLDVSLRLRESYSVYESPSDVPLAASLLI